MEVIPMIHPTLLSQRSYMGSTRSDRATSWRHWLNISRQIFEEKQWMRRHRRPGTEFNVVINECWSRFTTLEITNTYGLIAWIHKLTAIIQWARAVCSNMGIIKRNLVRPLPEAIHPLTPQVCNACIFYENCHKYIYISNAMSILATFYLTPSTGAEWFVFHIRTTNGNQGGAWSSGKCWGHSRWNHCCDQHDARTVSHTLFVGASARHIQMVQRMYPSAGDDRGLRWRGLWTARSGSQQCIASRLKNNKFNQIYI